jgi:hypothetical protein
MSDRTKPMKLLCYKNPVDDIMPAFLDGLCETSSIPPGILYRVPDSVTIWSGLIRDWNNPLGNVYQKFGRPEGPCRELIRMIRNAYGGDNSSAKKNRKKIGLLILGCGDGYRECTLCKQLLEQEVASFIKVALVDLSHELVTQATDEFLKLPPKQCVIQPVLLDFLNVAKLREFRNDYFENMSVVTLLLGNNLGNVDEREMVTNISEALSPDDLFLTEVLLHYSSDVKSTGMESAESDPMAAFITNSVRYLIGGTPRLDGLQARVDSQYNGDIMRKTYSYLFNGDEECFIRHKPTGREARIRDGTSISLLETKSMSKEYFTHVLKSAFADVHTHVNTYDLKEMGKIVLGYACGRRDSKVASNGDSRMESSIEVGNWNNVSIGIASPDKIYLYGSQYQDGAPILINDGTQFRIAHGSQVYRLLEAFAMSRDGHTLSWGEAADLLSHDLVQKEKSRFSLTDIESYNENEIELSSGGEIKFSHDPSREFSGILHNKVSGQVTDIAKKLRTALRKSGVLFAQRTKPPILSISWERQTVTSAPRVRFLLLNEDRSYRFSNRPTM